MNDKRVLHYQIFERLGIGGMGVVYRAVDSRLGRPVALKFLPESLQQDSEAAQRLIQEARAAAKLDHPNIGTVHAIETAPDGRVFMSMALYEGETLDARLERVGKLPFKEAVRIAMQVAQGLGHAHKAGVVHRDIKPGNIFLLSDGLVKILDFGIAKAAGMLDLTHTGALLGTNEYMSPQQVRGESVNQQADVWSLGVLLYKMIAGETPFFNEESPFAIIYAIATKTPDRLSVLDPALPAALDAVMDRALHKTLEGRYASTEEFHADLHALLSGGPVDPMTLTHYLETAAEAADPGGCPTNLPTRHRGIVGRAEELKLIDAYLADPDSRIVTLVGPGGMGKTSLSLAAAREQLEAGRFEHGIFFVALENTQMLDLVPEAIADAMGFSLQGPEPPERQVAARIGHKRILLVLDNFEHLVEGAGSLPELLADCPNLKVMVTSRVRLNLPEEWIIALQGLGVPPTGVGSSEDALAHGAVELFVRHARRVNPTFVLQSDNIEAVTEICRLVRGLPLGIELAAVWVRTLPAREIAREVQASYDFLASRSRGAGQRHLSIRAVFERSWELLDNSEREAVRRLAVFHASFTTDAAAAVTGTPLAVLAELADKSLLQRPSPDRFEQHPLIHQYSREKLEAERNLEQQMKDRHAVYFLDLLDRLAPIIRTARQRDALMAIDADLENIRAAWHWRTSQGAGEALGKAGGVLRVFFDQVGRAREGSQWFAAATSRLAGQSEHRAALGRLLVHQAWLTLQSGDMKGATKLVKSGMAFLKSAGDMRGLYWAANALGAAAATGGNFGAAKKQFETSLALAEHLKDGNLQSISLDNLGNVEQALGNEDVALRHYRKALELARRDNSTPQIIAVLNNLGSLFLATREPASARPLLEEGYDLARQVGIHRLIPYYLANLGQAYFLLGETKAAAKAYRDAILAARNANQLWLESALLADLARVATASRHTQHARAHVDRSLKLAFGLQDPPLILHAAACMSELLHSQGRKAEAAQLAEVVLLHPGARWEDKALAGGLVPGSPDPRGDAPEAVDWLERIQSAQAAL